MRAALAGLLVLASACTPTRFRLEPYRSDSTQAALLRGLAAGRCERRPTHPFTTDGCSMAPDLDLAPCCIEHDIAYWCGGPADERLDADRRLEACVIERGHSRTLAGLIRAMVRVGGAPGLPLPWRWGYGWDRGAGGG